MAMFGNSVKQPSKLANVAGSVGDFLLQYAGARPVFGPTMQRRQEIEFMNERDARNRSLDWQDYLRKDAHKRANPDPYRFEGNDGDIYELGPDGQPKKLFDDPTPKIGHIIADDGRGGKLLIQTINGIPQLGGGTVGDIPAPGTIIDDPRKGGASPGGSRPF